MRFVYWGLTALVAIASAVFAVHNRAPVTIDFWPFEPVEMPVFAIVLAALALGFVAGWLIVWLGHLSMRRERRRLARQAQRLEGQIDRTREPAPPGRSLVSTYGK
jgi:lipopolysaccharide assembly protein A